MSTPVRIAIWSGPRNISTALLRSWGNRPDTCVCDEPFYAHYLLRTGLDHPGREEVIAHHQTDWHKVVEWLTGPIPEGKPIFYQKHMAHHLLPDIGRDWLHKLTHCLLIREPRQMLTSLIKHLPDPTIADTGLPQQVEIAQLLQEHTGDPPPVIDARDLLQDPRQMLQRLCDALGVQFSDSMLSWPPGRRQTDGIWAEHWYQAVERSTGFQPYRPKDDQLPERFHALLAECRKHYDKLYQLRL